MRSNSEPKRDWAASMKRCCFIRSQSYVTKVMTQALAITRTTNSLLFPYNHTKISVRRRFSASQSISTMSTSDETKQILQDDKLESIFKQKRIVRSAVRKTLKLMEPSLKSQEDNEIQKIVLEAPWFKSSRRLCAYISCKSLNEVDTSRILTEILQNPDGNGQARKKLYVPRVEDKNSNMRMLHISHMDDLIANSMNILEPAPVDAEGNEREDVLEANEPADLFLLPGLAFDKSGRRLGRGGGYYDTFLTRYQKLATEKNWRVPLFVALSYSPQVLEEGTILVSPKDVPVDALVLPSGVIPISKNAKERM